MIEENEIDELAEAVFLALCTNPKMISILSEKDNCLLVKRAYELADLFLDEKEDRS